MNILKKIEEIILKLWRDPVWSKVISAGIILFITTIWAKYSNYSGQQIINFLILILSYKLPIFLYLSSIGLYLLSKILVRHLKGKIDPIWDEQIGNYKFKELHKIMSNQNLPVKTNGMSWSGRKPPEEDLLTMFYTYSSFFNKGVNLNDNYDDGGYLFGVLAPKLLGYGLLDKIETKNPEIDFIEINYQTSDVGYKFYALLEKSIHVLPKNRAGEKSIN